MSIEGGISIKGVIDIILITILGWYVFSFASGWLKIWLIGIVGYFVFNIFLDNRWLE